MNDRVSAHGIKIFGFANSDADSATRTLVALLSYDPRLPDLPDTANVAGALLRVGAFAAQNHYAALIRILKDIARTLGRDYSLPKNAFRIGVNSILPEKSLALSAGLGFIGRSSLFVSHAYGPACVIGVLAMPAACVAQSDAPSRMEPIDSCGSCSACVSACPTGAIGAAGLCREKCLQHWMSRDDFPDALLQLRGNRLYGCDECVRACPRSRGALTHAGLLPSEKRPGPFIAAGDLAGRDAAAVRLYFRGTALGMRWMPHASWATFAALRLPRSERE